MRDRYAVFRNFFRDAEEIREAVDDHFSSPERHVPDRHQVWNYWFVPGHYAYLRTMPEKLLGADLAQRLYDRIAHFAFETFGLANTTWPYLSVYVSGCHQGLHNDAKGGRLGYVYSVTRWDTHTFGGGETLLFADSPWASGIDQAKAINSFYDLVPPHFNQMLVFDDRVPHAVQRIEGTMDPVAGRVVLHGHLSETGVTIEGGLTVGIINPLLETALAETKRRQNLASSVFHGLLVLRLDIGPEGGSPRVTLLFDRVIALRPDLPPFPSGEFGDLFADSWFPRAEQPTRITIPIAFGGPLIREHP